MSKKVSIKLSSEQLSFLDVALDVAMDNEGDPECYEQLANLKEIVAAALEKCEESE